MGKTPTTAAAIGAEIEQLCSTLNEMGITVSGLMTDNCPTMKSVPKSIRFSNVESMTASRIIPVGCGSHILNLICKQWINGPFFKSTYPFVFFLLPINE